MLDMALGGTFLAAVATLQNVGRTCLPLVLATSAAEQMVLVAVGVFVEQY